MPPFGARANVCFGAHCLPRIKETEYWVSSQNCAPFSPFDHQLAGARKAGRLQTGDRVSVVLNGVRKTLTYYVNDAYVGAFYNARYPLQRCVYVGGANVRLTLLPNAVMPDVAPRNSPLARAQTGGVGWDYCVGWDCAEV